jgi:hypothetical protein
VISNEEGIVVVVGILQLKMFEDKIRKMSGTGKWY